MLRIIATALFALLVSFLPGAHAQQVVSEPTNASIDSAVGVCAVPLAVTRATVNLIGVSAYVTFNGSTPSSSNGFQYSAGQYFYLTGQTLTGFKIVGTTTGGFIHVVCTNG